MTAGRKAVPGTEAGPAAGGTAYDWLERHARLRPRATAVAVWRDGVIHRSLDFAQLSALVRRAAAALSRYTHEAGDRVVLALPNDLSFTAALLAATAAGLIAVPAPPLTADPAPVTLARLRGIVEDCRPVLVVSCGRESGGGSGAPPVPGVRHVVTWDDLVASADGPARPGDLPGSCDIGVLQYTSGSTGTPKGAVITHRAMRASCTQAAHAYRESPRDTAVTWVPLHHDMGLVTGILRPLFSGYASVLLEPRDFARAPASWLRAITALRATVSSAPDFAYGLCVRKVPAEQVPRLDLSSWRVARNAGEVVRADTADRFTAHFRAAGFRAAALCPSYGMAEATLAVTAGTHDEPALRLVVDRDALRAGRVVPAPHTAEPVTARSALLSSGRPLPGTDVAIGRPGDRTGRPDGTVGPIWIRGPQMFSGYWRGPGRSGTGGEGWHATGDLGFVHRGHLFVLGRADDTVVLNGRNFHASDIRAVCAGVTGLRPGRCVAFTTGGPGSVPSTPPAVRLVAEVGAGSLRDRGEVAADIRRRLASELELYVRDVELVSPGELPFTTSGKPMVNETRARYEERSPQTR